MKKIVVIIFLIFIRLSSYSQDSTKYWKENAGMYKSAKDYLNGKVEHVGEFVEGSYDKVVFKGEQGKIKFKPKTTTYWGYRDDKGVSFVKGDGRFFYAIVFTGKIIVYAWDITHVNDPYHTGQKVVYFDSNVYISKGIDGDLLGVSSRSTVKMLSSWIAEVDKPMADRLNKEHFLELHSGVDKVLRYVMEYNLKYPDSSK